MHAISRGGRVSCRDVLRNTVTSLSADDPLVALFAESPSLPPDHEELLLARVFDLAVRDQRYPLVDGAARGEQPISELSRHSAPPLEPVELSEGLPHGNRCYGANVGVCLCGAMGWRWRAE